MSEPDKDASNDAAQAAIDAEAIAKQRFIMLQLMRLGGVLLVVGGMLIISGKVDGPSSLGYGLLAFGAFEFFAMPIMMTKRWRTPKTRIDAKNSDKKD